MLQKKGLSVRLFDWLSKGILYIWCGFSIFAFIWIFLSSLKTNNEFFSSVWGFFKVPQWANYINVWTNYSLSANFLTSVLVVAVSVVGILVVSAPASYVLARIHFKGSGAVSKFFILGLGIPYQLLLIPLFYLLFQLQLIDSLWGLMVVYVALSLPFTIYLLMGFFRSLPHELEEAAYIDGCSPIKTFRLIMLPLGQPGIISAAIFNFVGLWNEFLLANTFIQSQDKYTLSIGLYGMQGSMTYTGDWVSLFAGFTVVIFPSLLIYIVLSRRIIEGLTLGAVKE
jgi:ABC-type glycerol-3-phosphate transport system permease component